MGKPKKVGEKLYTTTEVSAITGVSYRILDYWCHQGYVKAVVPAIGSGSRRMFDLNEVELIKTAHALVRQGFTPSTAARVAKDLRDGGEAVLGDFVVRRRV